MVGRGAAARPAPAGVALVATLVTALILVAPAGAEPRFAPLERPGPKLTIPREKLRASVECSADVRDAARTPVLLTPATGVDSESNFSWNYERLFAAEGIPYCSSDQQGFRSTNMSDVQPRGQYVTYAIRKVRRLAGRPIAVMGHSQGGMIMRLSLRFWPDTRRKVAEVIGIAPTNHGTDAGGDSDSSFAAGWQQGAGSRFIAALNSRAETFRGIDYTQIYTRNDEIVTPPAEAASLNGPGRITNVAIQEVCPAASSEHLMVGTSDPAAAALVLDALANPGPADPARISAAPCAQPWMGGIDPVSGPASVAAAITQLADSYGTAPQMAREPRLRCWTKLAAKACRQRRG